MDDVTYLFENGQVYAIREGKVIAAANDLDEIAARLAHPADHGMVDPGMMPPSAPTPGGGTPGAPAPNAMTGMLCPYCGTPTDGSGQCPACGAPTMNSDVAPGSEMAPGADMPPPGDLGSAPTHDYMSATIVGPGGLKGKVLGKVRDIYGDSITVRFENGRIAHLRVTQDGVEGGHSVSTEKTASAPAPKLSDRLTERLSGHFEPDYAGLTARLGELDEIRTAAIEGLSGATEVDRFLLDAIIVTADNEGGQLRQALDHITEEIAQSAANTPFEMQAAPPQESLGRGEGNWLDNVVSSMIAEAEAQDFETLVAEQPAVFVSDLSDDAIHDVGVTAAVAGAYIRSKTAGLDAERSAGIEDEFLARVEQARRSELSNRKQTIHKEAAAEQDRYSDLPDDILFG